MTFRIVYTKEVIKKDIPSLPRTARPLIQKAIETRLTTDPIAHGKPLRYGFSGQRRLRVSDYRVIYTVDMGQEEVTIHVIKHRKDVYE